MMKIYPATLAHTDDIVALNKTFVAVTSPMDASRFKHLFDISSLCLVAENEGKIVGFVLTMVNTKPTILPSFSATRQRLEISNKCLNRDASIGLVTATNVLFSATMSSVWANVAG